MWQLRLQMDMREQCRFVLKAVQRMLRLLKMFMRVRL